MLNATEVRKQWSAVCDEVVRVKPQFIKRTRDKMWFSNLETMSEILSAYKFTAMEYKEPDGSITLSLNEIDLVCNGVNEESAKNILGHDILEYAQDYYNEYELFSSAPNRKPHIPYIFKALIIDNPDEIGASITCQNGEN